MKRKWLTYQNDSGAWNREEFVLATEADVRIGQLEAALKEARNFLAQRVDEHLERGHGIIETYSSMEEAILLGKIDAALSGASEVCMWHRILAADEAVLYFTECDRVRLCKDLPEKCGCGKPIKLEEEALTPQEEQK